MVMRGSVLAFGWCTLKRLGAKGIMLYIVYMVGR